jgi:hypothetical protein
MEETAAAAGWLASHVVVRDVGRVFETGIVVTYARPFSDQGIGPLDRNKYAPASNDARRLHFNLIDLRNRLYAHTDETNYRWIQEGVTDVFGFSPELMGIPHGSAVEIVVELSNDLAAIAALAAAQAATFRADAAKVRTDAGAPPSSGRRLTAGGIPPTVRIGDLEVDRDG